MITKEEIERIYNCNIGKKCISCKIGIYKKFRISIMNFIICDNCGKNPIKK